MSIVTKYLDCEVTGISWEALFKLLIFTDENGDIYIRLYNNGTSNDTLESLSCDNPLSLEDIFRNLIVYDDNNNPALNVA